jgi:hypothetical protein
MAHYAFINNENIVVNVITGVDENIIQIDLDGTEVGGSSEAWETFYLNQSGLQNCICKRTSYNNNIRKQYAGIGYTYDPVNDVFIVPQPHLSWLLDENFDWQPPVSRPTINENQICLWDENTLQWIIKEKI